MSAAFGRCAVCGRLNIFGSTCTCGQRTERRLLTAEEIAALRDPDYLARVAADIRAGADMVEVDNPFRREVRPRRGTNEVDRGWRSEKGSPEV